MKSTALHINLYNAVCFYAVSLPKSFLIEKNIAIEIKTEIISAIGCE